MFWLLCLTLYTYIIFSSTNYFKNMYLFETLNICTVEDINIFKWQILCPRRTCGVKVYRYFWRLSDVYIVHNIFIYIYDLDCNTTQPRHWNESVVNRKFMKYCTNCFNTRLHTVDNLSFIAVTTHRYCYFVENCTFTGPCRLLL